MRDGVGRVGMWGHQGRGLGGPCRWAPPLPARTTAAFAEARLGQQRGAARAQGAELTPRPAAGSVCRALGCLCPLLAPSAGTVGARGHQPLSVFAGAAGLSLGTEIGLSSILASAGAFIGDEIEQK